MFPENSKQRHQFMLRLWGKEGEDGRLQWRGQLHHINSRDVRYFQDLTALIPLLLAMIRASQSQQGKKGETPAEPLGPVEESNL